MLTAVLIELNKHATYYFRGLVASGFFTGLATAWARV